MASLLLGKRVFPLESLQGPAVSVRILLGHEVTCKAFAAVAVSGNAVNTFYPFTVAVNFVECHNKLTLSLTTL